MRNLPKILSDDEVRPLLTATSRAERDLRDHMVILLALTTGLRVGEVVALNVADVKNGKGVKSLVTLRPETTKGKKPGEVAVPEKVRRKLVAYLSWKVERGELLT